MPPRRSRAKPASQSQTTKTTPPADEAPPSAIPEPTSTSPAAAAVVSSDATTSFKPPLASSREHRSVSRSVFKNPKAAELYDTLLARNPAPDTTFSQTELSGLQISVSDQELLMICQELVNLGLFQLLTLDGSICYRIKSQDDASKVQSLDKDARIIYNTIEAAGSSGIWTKTLKAKTNLHQTVLTRALKILESKSYVKQIKNARFPGRKIYMLQNLNPTDEVTGGPFFSDGELDEGLIEYASYFIIMFVRNKSWRQGPRFKKPIKASLLQRSLPQMLVSELPNSRMLLPHPAGYTEYPTAADILKMLDASGIFENKQFTEADLQILLDVLVFDNKLEVVRPGGNSSRSKPIQSTASLKRDLDELESDSNEDLPRRPGQKRRRVYGLRGSPSPQTADPNRRSPDRETPESDAESDPDPDPAADTMYRSVYRPGPPPPRPESIVVATEEPPPSTANPPPKAAAEPRKPPQKSKDATKDAEPSAAVRDDTKPDPAALPAKSKEQREHEQIEELLVPTNPVSETPCSRCPVFRFCEDGTRIDATTCEYFPKWLEEEQLGDDRRVGQVRGVGTLARNAKSAATAVGISA